MTYLFWAGVVAAALVAGWLVPAVLVPPLLSSLGPGARAVNHRGRRVVLGLGIAWPLASLAAAEAGVAQRLVSAMGAPGVADLLDPVAQAGRLLSPLGLVLGAFALGLLDDAYGDSRQKGLRGHLSALLEGRLTTGALKLVGLLSLAAVYASGAATPSFFDPLSEGGSGAVRWVAAWLAIALGANLVNLLDLRPGRALKVYLATGVPLAVAVSLPIAGPLAAAWPGSHPLVRVAVAAAIVLGPAVAVWRLDLGEHAMLGDAGANTMGALLGWLAALALPLWALVALDVFLLVLTLLSERVSFSKAIAGSPLLSAVDAIGRDEDGKGGGDSAAR